jgi:hypothetical protein
LVRLVGPGNRAGRGIRLRDNDRFKQILSNAKARFALQEAAGRDA